MPRSDPYIVLTQDGANKISNAPVGSGRIAMRHAPSEDLYVVDTVEVEHNVRIQVDIPTEYAALRWGDPMHAAQWMRKPADGINVQHLTMIRRPGISMTFDGFRSLIPGVEDPGAQLGLLITHDPDLPDEARVAGASSYAGWLIQRSGVRPIRIEVEPETLGLDQLEGRWPINLLSRNSIMVVGCGSIGSTAIEAIAGYGVGRVELVDPDRFLWHNILRHTLGPESVGRHKVDALKSHLNERWPVQDVRAHALDVTTETDCIRPLVATVDIILCAADGIAPRRVISHLARRADKPAVLACVLNHGEVGEIIRLRPSPRFGCLLCLREHLQQGGAMDAEADQELDYGTGEIHQPMTAVPPDLHLIGTLAAKASVATLLESLHGDHTQRLPGEHGLVSLRPTGDLKPPFGFGDTGAITWAPIPPPRPECPTCSVA